MEKVLGLIMAGGESKRLSTLTAERAKVTVHIPVYTMWLYLLSSIPVHLFSMLEEVEPGIWNGQRVV